MLSRIARGLYEVGAGIERAQNVTRILEVNHKMNLERAALEESNAWVAIAEAFDCSRMRPTESHIYEELVLSSSHPFSVRRCIETARDEARAMRDHISEEMWLHLNRSHLELATLSFEGILQIGRSEFNRRTELFANAFHGLANDTMIRNEAWSFLEIGKLSERATMICRILEIKRKSLALSPEHEGAPIDFHQWQALLRSLSGYEPYRRAYDARIVPERVLEFVLKRADFPRSLACTLGSLSEALSQVSGSHAAQLQVAVQARELVEELRFLDAAAMVERGSFEAELRRLTAQCTQLRTGMDLGYFTSLRPASAPIQAVPGAALVPQQ